MSGNNEAILRRSLERFREEKVRSMQTWLEGFCERVVKEAISARFAAPRARDFTGNLVNSIACALYRNGALVHASYSSDAVDPPTRFKMTYPRVYNFPFAYDGGPVRNAGPSPRRPGIDVITRGMGDDDALNFVRSFSPDGNAMFQVVLAYTTEYASYVEMKRKSTGYIKTVEFIKIEAPKILNAKL